MDKLIDTLTKKDYDYFQEVMIADRRLSRAKKEIDKVGRLTWNCHSVSRALRTFVPDLVVRDGFYYSFTFGVEDEKVFVKRLHAIRHSWLETPDGAIIDPRPVSFTTPYPVLMPAIEKHGNSLAGMYEIESVVNKVAQRKTVLRRADILQEFMKKEMLEETAD